MTCIESTGQSPDFSDGPNEVLSPRIELADQRKCCYKRDLHRLRGLRPLGELWQRAAARRPSEGIDRFSLLQLK